MNTYGPQVWETESTGIFNLTECVEKCGKCAEKGADFVEHCSNCVNKCAQYWPDTIDETIPFILGEEGTHGARSISVTRIDKDPLQDIIDDIEEGLDNELKSSKARETTKFRNAIADKEKFEIRTFELACIPREITKGLKVKVKDPSQPDVNGRVGVAKDQNEDKSRWNVEFEGKDGGDLTTEVLKSDILLETREVTQYHVKFWNDNTGLLGDGHVEMRDFLHFLVEQVDAHCRNMTTGPPIIHCRQVHHTTRARNTEHSASSIAMTCYYCPFLITTAPCPYTYWYRFLFYLSYTPPYHFDRITPSLA